MALTATFNTKSVDLSQVALNNPTPIQFGPDQRLYVSQQNGEIKAFKVKPETDSQGNITGYSVDGSVETIQLVKNIPNHNDNGDLNPSLKNRQVTGLVIEEGLNGEVILYVSSSDPRIGGGGNATDKSLDTNSGIISRLTLVDPDATAETERWDKVDLVIGLPRSEENHSTNGMDIRTEMVNGEPHQIMYVTSGGNTNRGAPSNNFAWISEYYYAAAVLKVDLTELEQIEQQEGLQGGTDYVDAYVYALPTLDDPTRENNAQGQDTAGGTTGPADAEAADTFGGNNGRNQAKYDPNGPVQVYSPGHRNIYDIVITEDNNIYTFDNGPNNGWGDVPLTAEGDAVTNSSQVATNNPNIDVDTSNDNDPDNLHLVTPGFYGGHPNPVYASGAAAGLYTVVDDGGTKVAIQLTDPSDPSNDPTTTEDDLPSDWDSISGGITYPEVGVYLGPGKNNLDGSTKGADGSLLSIKSSSNGLTEYVAGKVGGSNPITDNPDAEILVVAPFNGKITFIEVVSDGTQGGTQVTDTAVPVPLSGIPLDLTYGTPGIPGLENTVWVTQFASNSLTVLAPDTQTPILDTDQDDDGLDDSIDPLQFDPDNGTNTVLNSDSRLFWDFNPSSSGEHPGKGTPAGGPFNIGMTGWMINGSDNLDGLRDLDNTIRGGAPGIVQVKSVGSGNLAGSDNTQQDAIQTGFLPASDVEDITIRVPMFNPFSSDANGGITWSESASMGFTLGDGTMSNWIRAAVTVKDDSNSADGFIPQIKIDYEENDVNLESLNIDVPELLDGVDDDQVELFLTVNLETFEVTPSWRYQTNGIWSALEEVGTTPIQLDGSGQVVKALKGENLIDGNQSGSIVTLTSTSNGSEPFTADFLDLVIENVTPPDLSINDVSVNETEGSATFTVSLSEASLSEVTVDYATAEGTATAENDYNTTDGTLTFAPGETSQTVTVNILNDAKSEGDENFTLNLSNAVKANIADPEGTATITDNSIFAGINPVDPIVNGQNGSAQITITSGKGIQISNFGTSSFQVENTGDKRIAAIYFDVTDALFPDTVFDPVGLAGDSTSRGLLFSDTGSTGVFQPNSQEVLVPFFGEGGTAGYEGMLLTFDPDLDGGYETGEIIKFGVDMDPNSIVGLPQNPVDIDGNDPRINSWDIGGVSGAELINSKISVLFTDGTIADGKLLGDGSQGGSVAVVSQNSPNKEVSLTVNGLQPAESGSYSQDNIEVLVSGQAGDKARIVLAKGLIQPFDYIAPDGSAINLSEKFTNSPFPANNAIQFQTIDVVLDGTEQDITALFNFNAPGGNLNFPGNNILPIGFVASIIDNNDLPVGSVTEPIYLVHSDDVPPSIPELSIDNVTVNESAETATFTVSLSQASSETITVDYATTDGTATAGNDYTNSNGTLSFAAGETTQTLTVDISNDTQSESNETFGVNLSNANAATIADAVGTATIVDDDSDNTNPSTVLYRVNVGGSEVAGSDGTAWSADTNSNPSNFRVGTGGGAKVFTTQAAIDLSDTSLPPDIAEDIFQSERWDPVTGEEMQWEFPVNPGSTVEVRLLFAETYQPLNSPNKRVFDVAVEGGIPSVFDDIDPFAATNSVNSGFILSHTLEVTDGKLNLEFLHDIQNPALKGIEILSQDILFA